MFALLLAACSTPAPDVPPAPPPVPGSAPVAAPTPPALEAVPIPADGKYENVKIDGVTVPMIHLMDGGTVLLVDTDGTKPRTWEEQYKRKGDLPSGYFDLHKTNANHDDRFDDDTVDRQGRWKMDAQGNLTRN